MSKIKMRCTSCGKWFQSANAKEVTCPECAQRFRKEKLAAKSAQQQRPGAPKANPAATRPTPPQPRAKSPSGGSSHWLDTLQDVKVSEPERPARPARPKEPAEMRGGNDRPFRRGPGAYQDRGFGPGTYQDRGPGAYRGGTPGGGPRPRQPQEGGPGRGPRLGGPKGQRPQKRSAPSKPQQPPKPKREKIPPPAPFVPTPEQVAQVEARYKELAVPAEFDGIRTQIAHELNIPKSAVKKIVKSLREREGLPSWWEMQPFKGSSEELEKIRAAYVPYLPVPPIGIHKTIGEQLSLKPTLVYQAIKSIRQEMKLPQYNDPSVHDGGLTAGATSAENGQQEATSEVTAASSAGEGETVKAGAEAAEQPEALPAPESSAASE